MLKRILCYVGYYTLSYVKGINIPCVDYKPVASQATAPFPISGRLWNLIAFLN